MQRPMRSKRAFAPKTPLMIFYPAQVTLFTCDFRLTAFASKTGIESGSTVTPYYDSMLAKLIAYAETRDEALDKLDRALDETSIFGITTNLKFLKRLIALPATRSATFYTRLIDEQMKELLDKGTDTDTEALALGAYYWMIRQRQPAVNGPWQSLATTGWQMSAGGEGLSPIPIFAPRN